MKYVLGQLYVVFLYVVLEGNSILWYVSIWPQSAAHICMRARKQCTFRRMRIAPIGSRCCRSAASLQWQHQHMIHLVWTMGAHAWIIWTHAWPQHATPLYSAVVLEGPRVHSIDAISNWSSLPYSTDIIHWRRYCRAMFVKMQVLG